MPIENESFCRFCGNRLPGDQFGVTTQGPMSVTLVTDEDVAGLGFHAEITVSDAPLDVSGNDLQCKYTSLNTITKSKSFMVKHTVYHKCITVGPSLNYVQALLVNEIVRVIGVTYPERPL